jgi:hypothetical protein
MLVLEMVLQDVAVALEGPISVKLETEVNEDEAERRVELLEYTGFPTAIKTLAWVT